MKVIFNGQGYARVDDMPPEVRAAYQQAMGLLADNNNNGVPDIFDAMGGQGQAMGGQVVMANKFLVNNVEYGSLDEMPPEVRQLYEQAMQRMQGLGAGAQGFGPPGGGSYQGFSQQLPGGYPQPGWQPPPVPVTSGSSGSRVLVIVGLSLLLTLGVLALLLALGVFKL